MTFLRKLSYTYLRTRDNDFQSSRSLRHFLKKQTGKRIKALRNDNGGEFK
jgi:hypothetical protein